MSSRLGASCLAIGVILMGTAMGMTVATAGPASTSAFPAAFSTGFVIWSSCGILGLLIGLVASRRSRPGRTGSHAHVTPTATTTTPPSERFGAILEPVEGSA